MNLEVRENYKNNEEEKKKLGVLELILEHWNSETNTKIVRKTLK